MNVTVPLSAVTNLFIDPTWNRRSDFWSGVHYSSTFTIINHALKKKKMLTFTSVNVVICKFCGNCDVLKWLRPGMKCHPNSLFHITLLSLLCASWNIVTVSFINISVSVQRGSTCVLFSARVNYLHMWHQSSVRCYPMAQTQRNGSIGVIVVVNLKSKVWAKPKQPR